MTYSITDMMDQIDGAISDMSEEDATAIEQAFSDRPDIIFEWAEEGQIVPLTYMVRRDVSVLEKQDQREQTLLHYAANDHSGVMASILTESATPAVWCRDATAALPLDVAEACGNEAAINVLAPCTYPSLFLEELLPDASKEQQSKLKSLAAIEAQDKRQTRPVWMNDLEAQTVSSSLSQKRGQSRDQDR